MTISKGRVMKNGFTLIELIITVALAAIVLTMAVPSFRSVIQNNRATTQVNELVGALSLTRSEAVKRNAPVSICSRSTADPSTCANSTNWATGWLVFTDDGTAGTVDGTDEILRVSDPLAGSPTFTGTESFISYRGRGTVTAATVFTHTMADCTGNQVRTIDINLTGRANVTRSACP